MPMPTARDLRDRVVFQRRGTGDDGAGGTLGPWTELVGSRFAQLKPRAAAGAGAEAVIAQRLQGVMLFDLWVRYDSETVTVRTDDRVVNARDTTQVFNVRAGPTDIDRRRQWLLFLLEQGVADG